MPLEIVHMTRDCSHGGGRRWQR